MQMCTGQACYGIGRCEVCPNNEPSVFVCSGCGKTIYANEEYYDILGEQFCDSCITEARKVAEYCV